MEDVRVYSFSYNNPDRFVRMNERFKTLGISINWVYPVLTTDSRLTDVYGSRVHAVMYSHLDMIRKFLSSSASWGVFCEDDIYIRNDFTKTLRQAINGYIRMELDVLLLGYLIPYSPITTNINECHSELEPTFSFLTYGDNLWGAQMYLLDRKAAQVLVDKYGNHTKVEGPFNSPFCSDWTITKFGKRAAIYPMLAVEEGYVNTEHEGQRAFHTICKALNYNVDLHI